MLKQKLVSFLLMLSVALRSRPQGALAEVAASRYTPKRR